MEPNNLVTPSSQPQNPQPESVKAQAHNYAGALFFTVLIIGFTFNLPALIKIPLVFFGIVAGVMFFRDVAKPAQQITVISAQPVQVVEGPIKKRSPLIKILKIILLILAIPVALYIGFIILLIISFSGSGI